VNLIIAVSQDGPVHFYCPAKVAKGVYNENEKMKTIFETKFGTVRDNEVIHDKW